MSRNKLYSILAVACLAGYTWLYLNYAGINDTSSQFNVCIVKQVTDIPCPSCGSTRSVEAFIHGQFIDAVYWNPFGLIIISILAFTPLWLGVDLIRKKNSLYNSYIRVERFLNQRKVAIIGILLVLANWLWNIEKGL